MKTRKIHRAPSAEEQLILFSAGTAARRHATRGPAEELGALVNWSLVTELMRKRRLLSLLGPRLVELAGHAAGDELVIGVKQALDAGRRQSAFLHLAAARIIRDLATAGIRCSSLKGPQLSEALYGELGRRLSSDIDLLVAQEQLRDAVEVVRVLGYTAPTDHVDDRGLPLLHFRLIHERGELPPVELHWRVHWYESSFARDRLLAPRDAGGEWRPAPVDELATSLLFYARDGFVDLRLAADVAACWDAFAATLQPCTLDETILLYPELERVLFAAAKVAETTVGLPIGQLTERGTKLRGRGRVAVRLADPHPHSSSAQLYADMGLIDGLLAPPGGFRAFLRRQVVLPREVIQEHARHAQQARAHSTLGHSVRVLGRYGLAMAGLLRRPGGRRPRWTLVP